MNDDDFIQLGSWIHKAILSNEEFKFKCFHALWFTW